MLIEDFLHAVKVMSHGTTDEHHVVVDVGGNTLPVNEVTLNTDTGHIEIGTI